MRIHEATRRRANLVGRAGQRVPGAPLDRCRVSETRSVVEHERGVERESCCGLRCPCPFPRESEPVLPYPPDRPPDVLLEVFTLLGEQISVAPRIERWVQPDLGPGSQQACRSGGRLHCCRDGSRGPAAIDAAKGRRGSANTLNDRDHAGLTLQSEHVVDVPPVATPRDEAELRRRSRRRSRVRTSRCGDGPERTLLDSDRDCLRNRVDVVRHTHRPARWKGSIPAHMARNIPMRFTQASLPSTFVPTLQSERRTNGRGHGRRSHARSCQPSSMMNAAAHQSVRCHDPSPTASLGTRSRPPTAAAARPVRKHDLSETQRPADRPALHCSIGSSATRSEHSWPVLCPAIRAHATGEHPCPAAADRRHSCKVGAIPKL